MPRSPLNDGESLELDAAQTGLPKALEAYFQRYEKRQEVITDLGIKYPSDLRFGYMPAIPAHLRNFYEDAWLEPPFNTYLGALLAWVRTNPTCGMTREAILAAAGEEIDG